MDDVFRSAVVMTVAQGGPDVLENPQRFRALMSDVLGVNSTRYRDEIQTMSALIESGVGSRVRRSAPLDEVTRSSLAADAQQSIPAGQDAGLAVTLLEQAVSSSTVDPGAAIPPIPPPISSTPPPPPPPSISTPTSPPTPPPPAGAGFDRPGSSLTSTPVPPTSVAGGPPPATTTGTAYAPYSTPPPPGSPPGATPPPFVPGAPPGAPVPSAPKQKSSLPLILAVVGVLALLVIGAGFVLLRGGDDDKTVTSSGTSTSTSSSSTSTTGPGSSSTTTDPGGTSSGGGAYDNSNTTLASDTTDTISFRVPDGWETNGASDTLPDGSSVPDLAAGPDVDSFLRTFDDAGIRLAVFGTSFTQSVDDSLDFFLSLPNSKNFAFSDCDGHGRYDYSSGDFTGKAELLDCGGSAVVTVYALSPPDSSYLVLIEGQTVTNADIDAIAFAIDTLTVSY